MTVVDLKRTKKLKRAHLVTLAKDTGAGRFFSKMVRDIQSDLAGRRNLTRIENELIGAFCGAATHLQYLNHQIMLGESREMDLAGYSQLASTMLRIGSRLGFARRAKDVTPTLSDYLNQIEDDDQRKEADA